MLKIIRTHLVLVLCLAAAGPVLAQADPTLHQISEAAQSGHLAQAQQMVNQVLRDHPQSAKAHYVAAELYAREGNFPSARQELGTAEALEPGLPFAQPNSVAALQRELASAQGSRMGPRAAAPAGYARVRTAFPWGWALVLVGAIAVLWAALRRRAAATVYAPYPSGATAGAGAPGYGPAYGSPGYGAPGIGSGIAGGLASGLAVGAGVVAGEELAHHFLDGDRQGNVNPVVNDPGQSSENSDMGGPDFGVSDGSSWDDGGSVGGDISGGDDWT